MFDVSFCEKYFILQTRKVLLTRTESEGNIHDLKVRFIMIQR